LRNFPLRSIGTTWVVVLIISLGLVVPLVSVWVRPLVAVGTGLLSAAIFIPGALILAFNQGKIVPSVYPLAALILSTIGALAVPYVRPLFDKQQARSAATKSERERIERDLHDGAQQRLVALALELRLAERELARSDADTRTLLGAAVDSLQTAVL